MVSKKLLSGTVSIMASYRICVVGLGYVGLPLALEFAKHFPVVGFDINVQRVSELSMGKDTNNETDPALLKTTTAKFSAQEKDIQDANFFVVTVPTPIDESTLPDLGPVRSASHAVGRHLKKGDIVVYESTVYPGVTEEICVPILEKESGLKFGKDFKMGYSPERIDPGNKEHRVDSILKIVSGSDSDALEIIAEIYSKIVKAGLYRAPNIKTAEAAKVIENIQRDLNIALVNELSKIFRIMGLNTQEVLAAAGTKWNFHKYYPGLVGGHCIGVDPYYLTYKAEQLGYRPEIILAGRKVNESMAPFVANICMQDIEKTGKKLDSAIVLVAGLTFKENVPDIRNSKALDVILTLRSRGVKVIGYEPKVDPALIHEEFGVDHVLPEKWPDLDAAIVIHQHLGHPIDFDYLIKKMRHPILFDLRGYISKAKSKYPGLVYHSL